MAEDRREYVLGPLDALLGECHSNVLLAFRIAEKLEKWPVPTEEELGLLQFGLKRSPPNITEDRPRFKRWILLKGFGDVHKAVRAGLERLLVCKIVDREIANGSVLP